MDKIAREGILIFGALMLAAWAPVSVRSHVPPAFKAEICDNAQDDDDDGLIDLNDPDCDCPPPEPVSLIPNPSFEEQECCPGNSSQMYCTADWLQASIPTTDYINTCGWLGWPDFTVPLPIPDGDGCVGFRNGRPGLNSNDPQPNWKEYAGACLAAPMKIGEYYRIEFYVGFAHPRHSPPINIAFYGASSCSNLPFDEEDAQYGCPTNDVTRGWTELAKVRVSGVNNWQKSMVEFTPNRDIEAIAIGPDCERKPSMIPYYYFLDNLILAERVAFEEFNIRASGNLCAGNAVLEVADKYNYSYQWYKDGIALIGETGARLSGALQEGHYQVRLMGPGGCSVTDAYPFRIPVKRSVQEEHICPGDDYEFNGQYLRESGVYHDTLQTTGGCDSIVELQLSVVEEAVDTVYAKIFDAEVWTMNGRRFDQPGEYTLSLQSSNNCDSLVYLMLDRYDVFIPSAFSPNSDGINDFFSIYGDAEIREVPELQIFDRWGSLVFAAKNLDPADPSGGWDGLSGGQPAPNGVYVYLAKIVFDDGKARAVSGTVTLVK